MQGVGGGPDSRGGHVEHEPIDQAADLGALVEKRLRLECKPVGTVPVVVIPMHDDRSSGTFTRKIAFGPNRELAIQPDICRRGSSLDEASDGIDSIVDDNQFTI